MSHDIRRRKPNELMPESWPAPVAAPPVWTSEARDGELSIAEHAEAIALVEALRPYCIRWSVDLQRSDIADEIGLILAGEEAAAVWAIYRDAERTLRFEDLVDGMSYTFATMESGLRFVRAVLEAAAATAQEQAALGKWWERLPAWLLADAPLQPGA